MPNDPNHVDIVSAAIFGLRRAVVEDPYTEPMLELYGRIGRDSISVYNTFNLRTAECAREVVCYGNQNAKTRLDADEEASAASCKSADEASRRIGQAHSHPYKIFDHRPRRFGLKRWRRYKGVLELSRHEEGDIEFIKDIMTERHMQEWLEILMVHRTVRPVGVRSYFMMNSIHPKLVIHNSNRKTSSMPHGFGLEIDFSAHYVQMTEDSEVRVKELPLRFDEKFLNYVTVLPLRT